MQNNRTATQQAQQTEEWFKARLGRITSSRFKDVLVQPRTKAAKAAGELSKTAQAYLHEKVAEWITGESKSFSTPATQWGNDHEEEARQFYENTTGNTVTETGYIAYSEMIGGSPDGLVGDDGTIEIKCPYSSHNHVKTMLTNQVPVEYVTQVQGHMLVTGRQWCDFISYDPRCIEDKHRIHVIRVERDEEYIAGMLASLVNFEQKLIEALDSVGYWG